MPLWLLGASWVLSRRGEHMDQTLFFNHRRLQQLRPAVSPDKPMGQLRATSSVFEAQSLITVKSPWGLSEKFAHRRWLSWGSAPRVSRIKFNILGTSLRQIFPDNPFRLFTVCMIANVTKFVWVVDCHYQNVEACLKLKDGGSPQLEDVAFS